MVVASDCSTDGTDDLVRSFSSSGVRLVRLKTKGGKEAAQKQAVESTAGEILVFSDTATMLKPTAITTIVQNFADPTVGCVSSVDRFIDVDGTVSGEGAYVRYEMLLRQLETRVNTLVGLSGSFFAARRSVSQGWAPDLQSDFNTLLNTVRADLPWRGRSGECRLSTRILPTSERSTNEGSHHRSRHLGVHAKLVLAEPFFGTTSSPGNCSAINCVVGSSRSL